MNQFRHLLYVFSGLLLTSPWLTQAGDIDSPAPPDDEISAMFTLQDIHDRLNDGSAGAQRGAFFVDPISGPGASVSANLNDIMGIAPSADLLNGAAAGQVLQGRTFWGLDSAAVWGPATGSMPDIGAQVITPGTTAQTIATGFHDGDGGVAGDSDLTSGNILAGVKIFGVAGIAIEATGKATASQVLSGVTFSNDSGAATGSMPNIGAQVITPGTTAQAIATGFHDGDGGVAGDSDLTSGNIRAEVKIFGVAGASNVVDTTSGDAVAGDLATGKKAWVEGKEITGNVAPSPVGETGQTTCYDPTGATTDPLPCGGTGQDGDLRPGVVWPTPRFTKNYFLFAGFMVNDGTVTDNLTGLIWLQDADCFGIRRWATALNDANTLAHGTCGLFDGSAAGDWRLPSVKELVSLIDYQFFSPALSNAAGTAQWIAEDPFANVQNDFYWSSSSFADVLFSAWFVDLSNGSVGNGNRAFFLPVWPVRGGQ